MYDLVLNLGKLLMIILGLAFWPFMFWTALFSKRHHIQTSGAIKRGIPLYYESVSPQLESFLRNLHVNTDREVIQYDDPVRRIILTTSEVMAYAEIKGFSTGLPYIAYIDLTHPTLRIEYRVSISGFIATMIFIFGIIMILFAEPSWLALLVLGIFIWVLWHNHRKQMEALRVFLKNTSKNE